MNLIKNKTSMRRLSGWVVILLFALLKTLNVSAIELSEKQTIEVRSLINLLDYISKDYPMAVENGAIINEFEFAEMQEFSGKIQALYLALKEDEVIDDRFNDQILALNELVNQKASPTQVGEQADAIRNSLVDLKIVPLAPTSWPDLEKGKALYATHCASCHGQEGKGDGEQGIGLEPSPSNFHEAGVINKISPLQAFNTISLGIDGTAMRGFTELTEEEVWNLSYFLLSFPYQGNAGKSDDQQTELTLEETSSLSNEKILHQYPNANLASIRLYSSVVGDQYIRIAHELLSRSATAYEKGDVEAASSFALKAYLQGVEPIEPKIKASDNKLFEHLESAMMKLRAVIDSKDEAALEQSFAAAHSYLNEAEDLIGNGERSMFMTAVIAFSILIREGLEAFFVILAILSILQSMQAKRAVRWVHGGWLTAVTMGIAGWFFADAMMTWDAQSRELMEGLIALVAVIVLLYLGFWMHGKTNAAKWKAFVETRVKGLITRNNMIGLASFSFLVVFREAFESVLFLSSLTVDGSFASSMGVLLGSITAAGALLVIAWSMLKWFKKMPIHKVFLYSSIVVLALAFVLVGEGIHAIQEGGYLAIRSFPLNIKLSWIGLYPTYETILSQLFVFGMIVLLWRWSKRNPINA